MAHIVASITAFCKRTAIISAEGTPLQTQGIAPDVSPRAASIYG